MLLYPLLISYAQPGGARASLIFRLWLMINLITAIAGAVLLDEKESSSDLWVVFCATAMATILEVLYE